MSIDFALKPKADPTSQIGTSGSPFSPKTSDKEEPAWLMEVLQVSDLQAEEARRQEPWVFVAPGFYVQKSEYQRRFAEVDLEYYRQRMSPKLFTAFVRHMGAIPGSPGLDVVELTTLPDF